MTSSIPKFPILYKIKNNKIYQWNININKINDNLYRINYFYGQKDLEDFPNLYQMPDEVRAKLDTYFK